MNKFLRRQIWLISTFLKRYYQIIIVSLLVSLSFGFGLNAYLKKSLTRYANLRIGLIGQYTGQNLPGPVKDLLHSGLTKVGANGTIVPNMAQNWEISEGGKVYTFTLKPGLTWSDGTSVKTKDIQINIPDVNITTPTDDKIVFVLPQPFSPFPSVMTNPITNKTGLTISRYKVTLSQNTNGTLNKIKLVSPKQTINYRIFTSTNLALTAYKLGELDAIYDFPHISNQKLDQLGQVNETNNYQQAVTIFFNNQDVLLKDKNLRQGIAYAIKDKTLGFIRATGPISQNSWAFNPLVKLYDYDLAKATKLIRTALPEKNQVLNLELATIPQYLSVAENIKSQLNPKLINLNIKVVTSRPESYQLYLTLFEIPIDPDQYVFWHSSFGSSNISKANDEKIDKDLEDGRRTLDQNERKRIYNEFQRTFTEELPSLFLFYPRYYDLARKSALFDIIKAESAL